jgi:anti-sigma factor RsiW
MANEDPYAELDIGAFLDGQLDEAGRRAALSRLSLDPLAAARAMGDMALAQALRNAAMAQEDTPTPRLVRSARRLQRSLALRLYRRWSARAAAVLIVFLAGYGLGEADLGLRQASAPAFVSEAMMSHRTALVRASMVSQPESARFDPAEIRTATQISLPPVPPSWRVTDAQIYPSDDGPSVGLSFATPEGAVSLFAFRTQTARALAPQAVKAAGKTRIAYWQEGDLAFALISGMPAQRLEAIAQRMALADLPGHAS